MVTTSNLGKSGATNGAKLTPDAQPRTKKIGQTRASAPSSSSFDPRESSRYLGTLGGAHRAPLLEAFAAKHGSALSRAERYRGFLSTLGTVGFSFGPHRGSAAPPATDAFGAFGLASFAALGLVLEALVREKHLLARSKNKLSATLRTLQDLIVVFH
jgi:hypothetical protein